MCFWAAVWGVGGALVGLGERGGEGRVRSASGCRREDGMAIERDNDEEACVPSLFSFASCSSESVITGALA